MDSGLEAAAVAGALAILAATLVYRFAGATAGNWVRRALLILINLCPGGIGTWRRSFTRRETAYAAGFLVFVLALIVLAIS